MVANNYQLEFEFFKLYGKGFDKNMQGKKLMGEIYRSMLNYLTLMKDPAVTLSCWFCFLA